MRCCVLVLALDGDVGTVLLRESLMSFILPGVEGLFFGDCARPARSLCVADYLPKTCLSGEPAVANPDAPIDDVENATTVQPTALSHASSTSSPRMKFHMQQFDCGGMAADAAINVLRDAALAAGFTHALLARTHEQLVQLPFNQRVESLPVDWQHTHVYQVMSDVAWRPRVDVLVALASFVFVGALLPTPVPVAKTAVHALVARAWPAVAIAAEAYTIDVRTAMRFVAATTEAARTGIPPRAHARIAADVLDFQLGLSLFQAEMFGEARVVFDRRVAEATKRTLSWNTAPMPSASTLPAPVSFTALMDRMMACRARFEACKSNGSPLDSLDPFFELADAWLRHGCADGLILLHAAAAHKQLARVSTLALAAFLDTRLVPGLQTATAPTAGAAAHTPFHCADANSFGAQLMLGITRQMEESAGVAASLSSKDASAMRVTGGAAHALLLFAHHHPSSAHAAPVHEQFEDVAKQGDNMPLARQLCRAAATRQSGEPAFAVFTGLLPDPAGAAAAFTAAAMPSGCFPPWEWFAAWVAHITRSPPLRWLIGPALISTTGDALRIHAPQTADARQYTLLLATGEAIRLEFHNSLEALEANAAPQNTLVLAPGSACWLSRPHDAMCVFGNCAVVAVMTALPAPSQPPTQRFSSMPPVTHPAYTPSSRVTFP